jgi:hypothetical protein
MKKVISYFLVMATFASCSQQEMEPQIVSTNNATRQAAPPPPPGLSLNNWDPTITPHFLETWTVGSTRTQTYTVQANDYTYTGGTKGSITILNMYIALNVVGLPSTSSVGNITYNLKISKRDVSGTVTTLRNTQISETLTGTDRGLNPSVASPSITATTGQTIIVEVKLISKATPNVIQLKRSVNPDLVLELSKTIAQRPTEANPYIYGLSKNNVYSALGMSVQDYRMPINAYYSVDGYYP